MPKFTDANIERLFGVSDTENEKPGRLKSRFVFDQHLDFGFSWEIHPAYRWALQPETVQSAFEQIDLDADD